MPNMRLIREGLEAADDLVDILLELHGSTDTTLARVVKGKRKRIHVALREAVEAERNTHRNRRDTHARTDTKQDLCEDAG